MTYCPMVYDYTQTFFEKCAPIRHILLVQTKREQKVVMCELCIVVLRGHTSLLKC